MNKFGVLRFLITFFFLCLVFNPAITQSGRVYEFLNLPSSARITAMGGYGIPDTENDLNMALFYPSLINEEMHQQLSLNFVDYFDDIHYGTAAYSHTFERYGSFTGRIHYISYGEFDETDELGNKLGTFGAGEYSAIIGWGRQLSDNFYIGSNFKIIGSDFYDYSSFGLAADVSGSYINHDELFAASILFRNIGRQVTYYHSGNSESLPFEIVAGASKKLLNAPIRLYGVAHNLQKYDLTYEPRPLYNNNHFEEAGINDETDIFDFADLLMHHFIFGIEFLPTDNLSFRAGYNYRRRQEMQVETRASTVGFSWGMGVKISRFEFSYGRADYHLAASPNHISVSIDIGDVFEGRRVEVDNDE